MIKLIFKNLWNRRGRLAWLFIELIIISMVSFTVIDRGAVSLSDYKLPTGYDDERLALVSIASLPEVDSRFSAEHADSAMQENDFHALLQKIKTYADVEMLAPVPEYSYINSMSLSVNAYFTGNPADSLLRNVSSAIFYPGCNYFETYGFKAVEGSPTPAELSAAAYRPGRDVVLTEDYARRFWPDGDAVGKKFIRVNNGDTTFINVVGVVGGARWQTVNRTNDLVFFVWEPLAFPLETMDIVVRLREGVDPVRWAADFTPWAARNLVTGNYYAKSVTPYSQIIDANERVNGATAKRAAMLVLLLFFLVNLVLGVTGSFYLQTRRRIEEMGIHRSFGARRSHIMAMLMGEGAVLATVASALGLLILLQIYLYYGGLNNGFGNNAMFNTIDNWVGDFGLHFAIIAALDYLMILLCTLIGTWLPALKVSRIEPVEALRTAE